VVSNLESVLVKVKVQLINCFPDFINLQFSDESYVVFLRFIVNPQCDYFIQGFAADVIKRVL